MYRIDDKDVPEGRFYIRYIWDNNDKSSFNGPYWAGSEDKTSSLNPRYHKTSFFKNHEYASPFDRNTAIAIILQDMEEEHSNEDSYRLLTEAAYVLIRMGVK